MALFNIVRKTPQCCRKAESHNQPECDKTDLCCISKICEADTGTQSVITYSGLTDHKLGVRNVVTTLERGVNYGLSDRAG